MKQPPNIKPTRVMVVDKDAGAAAGLAGKLRRAGYEVCAVVDSGEEAIRLSTNRIETGQKPDVVLMGILLNGAIDGVQAGEAIQNWAPVVYMTNYISNDFTDRLPGGDQSLLAKPVQTGRLIRAVETAVRTGRANLGRIRPTA